MVNCDGKGSNNVTDRTQEYVRIRFNELGYRLLYNWYWILGLALACSIALAAISVYLITPTYRATATFYVLDAQQGTVLEWSDLQVGEALTKDYSRVFTMWEVHDQVKTELGLQYSYSQMQDMLSVSQDQASRMLDITVSSHDPSEAAAMANKYAEVSTKFISEIMKTETPRIVSAALVPTAPSSPGIVKNVALGFILGAFFAGAIVVLKVIFDDKIKTAEDIERYTGLPTLAVVPLQNK